MLRLVIVSGRSGSGKTSALNILEDVGFTCIDNLPASLLPNLIKELNSENSGNSQLDLMNDLNSATTNYDTQLAVGIDARNIAGDPVVVFVTFFFVVFFFPSRRFRNIQPGGYRS